MAAILRRQLADEGRLPERPEAVAVAYRRHAREQRVDEHRPAVGREGHIVGVDIAGDPRRVRREDRVVGAGRLSRRHDVVEALNLVVRREREGAAARRHAKPHAAREAALEHRQPPVALQSDQEDLAGLVGGEGEARPHARQPLGEVPRA